MELFLSSLEINILFAVTMDKVQNHVSDVPHVNTTVKELRGLSPHANYTDWAAAAGRRS